MKSILPAKAIGIIAVLLCIVLQAFVSPRNVKSTNHENDWFHYKLKEGQAPTALSPFTLTGNVICTGSIVFVSYEVMVTNTAATPITGAIFKDIIPAGVNITYLAMNSVGAPVSNATLAAGISIKSTGAAAGVIAPGATVTISFFGISSNAPGVVFNNQGFISYTGSQADPDAINGEIPSDDPNTAAVKDPASLTTPNCGQVLPVTLVNFTATKVNNRSVLTWATAQETNSAAFDVLRKSVDGTWQKIATIAAAGNSQQLKQYSYTDNQPLKGINYYKLIQKDLDGAEKESTTRQLSFDNLVSVNIFPNPVTQKLTIQQPSENSVVTVFDTDGKKLAEYKKFPSNGSIDMSAYRTGVYMISITDQAGNKTNHKIIKK